MIMPAAKSIIKKSKTTAPQKITSLKEIEEIQNKIIELTEKLEIKDQLQLFEKMGVGTEYFTCQRCGKIKKKKDFYVSTVMNWKSGITNICKTCAADIANPMEEGKRQQPTKESVDDVLYALDKPFLDSVWEASLLEAANQITGKSKSNVFNSYIKNIQMPQYCGMTYRHSDNYNGGMYSIADMEDDELPKDQEIIEQFEKNKADTVRLIGYLPFEKEKITDQPFLYAQLIGFLDSSEHANEDMMRTSSIISIVRGFMQLQRMDDMVSKIVRDIKSIENNISAVRNIESSKKDITLAITKLAEQSCISLKNSKSRTKGENTWTGKIKRIKDLNLREGEINGFDVATCKGMMQVMEMSDASIMKQLALDESEWSDIVADQREIIRKTQADADNYKEISRILLRENIDLRDSLEENGLLKPEDLNNLDNLYSCFRSSEREEEETYESESENEADYREDNERSS